MLGTRKAESHLAGIGIDLGFELEKDDVKFQESGDRVKEKEVREAEHVNVKATKADNPKVPEYLWNDEIAKKIMLT